MRFKKNWRAIVILVGTSQARIWSLIRMSTKKCFSKDFLSGYVKTLRLRQSYEDVRLQINTTKIGKNHSTKLVVLTPMSIRFPKASPQALKGKSRMILCRKI